MNHWENTLEAFESAPSLGADMVELDCKLTRDGHVVVLHDTTLRRPWGVPRAIKALRWEEVSAIRRQGYRIPEFAEVLSAVQLPVMVDVPSVEVLEAAYRVATAENALDRCVFAGHTGALVRLRKLSKSARIALSWDKRMSRLLQPPRFCRNACRRYPRFSLVDTTTTNRPSESSSNPAAIVIRPAASLR